MKNIIAIIILIVCVQLQAQTTTEKYPIVPKPQILTPKSGNFTLNRNTVILIDEDAELPAANFLNDYMYRYYFYRLKIVKKASQNYIRLSVKRLLVKGIDGKYDMQITPDYINISGDTYQGTFYGVQTILQLLPTESTNKLTLPCANILDEPRFKYRGLHLDVARHFMPVDFIKKYIDYIAYYKLNTFHWHLTDDQGWRIEIKKYPKLTSVGGWRYGTIVGRYPGTANDNMHYGGYYTQEEIKEVVQYAKNRFITVIPEIEMPGHASAAIAAYPQLSCFPEETTIIPGIASEASQKIKGKKVQETWGVFEDVFAPTDYTFNFLQDVVDEVMELFPAEYIHIGGDECPKESWKRSPFCQQLIKDKGLKDEHGLQSYFIQKMEKYINGKGKKIIGWDEILEGGLAPNAAVMSWRGEEGGITAAQQGHEVVMTPGSHCYLDHSQSKNEDSVTIGGYLPIETVYSYNPVPAALSVDESKFILGAQGNLWTEYIKSPAKVEYMLFPRLAALSEVLWTFKSNKSWEDFERRLPVVFERLNRQKVKYSEAYYDLKTEVKPTENNSGVIWKIKTKRPLTNFRITTPLIIPKGTPDKYVIQAPDLKKDFDGSKRLFKDTLIRNTLFKDTQQVLFNDSVLINNSGFYSIAGIYCGRPLTGKIEQTFIFNKATGKKITLTTDASKSYPGDGAFTLVNGVQNEKGLSRSSEFLGFNGGDCDATIDLGKTDKINKVMVHCLEQNGSWIYLPKSIEISTSGDGVNYMPQPKFEVSEFKPGKNVYSVSIPAINTRFVKIKINNHGKVEDGKPGAGNPAWLFVDEIEVW